MVASTASATVVASAFAMTRARCGRLILVCASASGLCTSTTSPMAGKHDVRLEQVLPLEPGRRYPICIGGRRAVPPEDCGGPWAFLELRQHYSVVTIADRMLALLSPLIADRRNAGDNPVADRDDVQGDQSEDGADHAEEFATLLHWLRIDRFDRRATNCRLAQIEVAPARAAA